MTATVVEHYFDYKSPYAYLAQAASWRLGAEPGVTLEWRPYTLQIPKYLGAAELAADGSDTVGTRNDHQWRRVRYAYMDCRREANRRGLTIRGPRKIFDSVPAHVAFLWVSEQGEWRRFHDAVFERFWRRELDIEDAAVLTALMRELGYADAGFEAYLEGPGRARHDAIQAQAEAVGVFGVPSWRVGEELFWGLERLPRVYELLGRPVPPEET
ncbi:MAG: DsbA family protein [Gammaproteobacteria bacterium]|nr:DsbA family protein [Gammaproteobacteria bacterium]